MGTVVSIDVRGPGVAAADLQQVVDWLQWVDATFSTYRPDSAVNRLGRGEIAVGDGPPELAEVLHRCAAAREATHGYFTATPYGALDPSGLVKGWAIERASELLRAAGSTSHAVNGGGDIQLAGDAMPGRPWRVGIADPLRPGRLVAVVAASDRAVATSGLAERGSHVIDPFTGRPATDLAAVTLVGDHLAVIDAYATAAFAMGRAARHWIEALPGVEALAVAPDGRTWRTAGFPDVSGAAA